MPIRTISRYSRYSHLLDAGGGGDAEDEGRLALVHLGVKPALDGGSWWRRFRHWITLWYLEFSQAAGSSFGISMFLVAAWPQGLDIVLSGGVGKGSGIPDRETGKTGRTGTVPIFLFLIHLEKQKDKEN